MYAYASTQTTMPLETIEAWAEDGWELVAVVNLGANGRELYFRRRKSPLAILAGLVDSKNEACAVATLQ